MGQVHGGFMVKQRTLSFILFLISLSAFIHCGTENYTASDGESVPVASNGADGGSTPSESICVNINDCDDDGVYKSCDDDDVDATNTAIKDGCDSDADGFVDVYCVDENLSRDLDGNGLISAAERDVNCDTCPGTSDPLQTDSDEDGYGDACGFSPDINISEETPTDDDVEDDDTTEPQEDEIDGTVVVTLIDSESPVKQNSLFDVAIELTNNTNKEDFVVQVLLQPKTSSILESEGPTTSKFLTFVGSCSGATANCTALGEDEITLSAGETVTLETNHTIPKSLDTGKYTVRIQVVYVAENGSETIVGRNPTGLIITPSSDSSIEVTGGWSFETGPMVIPERIFSYP